MLKSNGFWLRNDVITKGKVLIFFVIAKFNFLPVDERIPILFQHAITLEKIFLPHLPKRRTAPTVDCLPMRKSREDTLLKNRVQAVYRLPLTFDRLEQ